MSKALADLANALLGAAQSAGAGSTVSGTPFRGAAEVEALEGAIAGALGAPGVAVGDSSGNLFFQFGDSELGSDTLTDGDVLAWE